VIEKIGNYTVTTDNFNFYTALALLVMLLTLFILSFVAGFLTLWLAFPTVSSTDTMIYIEDEEAFHQACFSGMRRGIQ
jgi:uncharacterized membrane protein (DUF485 family)